MNYFEHHIGDYDEATAHLSAVEDGIYSRLLRKYYATEKPLPADVAVLQRLVRARTREEKKAVTDVLAEFFLLGDGGFHQRRCDEDIERFQSKSNKAKASANARWDKERAEALANNGDANAYANASEKPVHIDSERNANASGTHEERNAPQSPVPRHQSPDTKHQGGLTAPPSPPVLAQVPPAPSPRPKKTAAEKPETPTAGTWKAYAQSYETRYGATPVRNAAVNGQLAGLVGKLGADEAPAVAAFYVRSNDAFYVRTGHSVGALLRDAEKLRTEWATGRQGTQTQARLGDRAQSNFNAFAPLIEEARAKQLAEHHHGNT